MPLARHGREVTSWPQHFGNGDGAFVEPSGRADRAAADDVFEVTHAGLMRVQTGQETRARRRAPRRAVELCESSAACGECVEVRRGNLAAIRADVRPSHVVYENDDDVRPRAGLSRSSRAEIAERADAGRYRCGDEHRHPETSRTSGHANLLEEVPEVYLRSPCRLACLWQERTLMKILTAIICVVGVASVGPAAQSVPDFSGTWTMDLTRSEAAAQGTPTGPVTVAIRQTPGEVNIETTRNGRTEAVRYLPVSVKATAAAEPMGSFRWDGAKLITRLVTDINKQAITV